MKAPHPARCASELLQKLAQPPSTAHTAPTARCGRRAAALPALPAISPGSDAGEGAAGGRGGARRPERGRLSTTAAAARASPRGLPAPRPALGSCQQLWACSGLGAAAPQAPGPPYQQLPPVAAAPACRMKSAALLAVALLCCASVASARLFSSPEEWKAEARRSLQGESQPAAACGGPACLQPLLAAPIAFAACLGLIARLGRRPSQTRLARGPTAEAGALPQQPRGPSSYSAQSVRLRQRCAARRSPPQPGC